jgi:hypothetical protein
LLEEACLQWPYDPDFESEEYYEHEDRLDIDGDYAAAFQEEALCRVNTRMRLHEKDTRDWIDFWIRALHNAPNGPTLFHPPASQHHQFLDLDVPGYLFRTFDASSQGTRQNTGNKEIELALKIAQRFFKSIDQIDMSCLLLAFQNRGLPGKSK